MIGRLWAGRLYGTNIGNIFLKLDGEDKALKGTLHLNETGVAVAVYELCGVFEGSRLSFDGTLKEEIPGVAFGRFEGSADLQPNGELRGEWKTTIGTAGTFVLFPHDQNSTGTPESAAPEQLYTARHNFGPIEIDRDAIVTLAEDLQKSLPKSRVVVTIVDGTEQARYLDEFKQLTRSGKAEFLKLFARQADTIDLDKTITIELGQTANWAIAQGSSESWALGELEKLKRDIKKYERVYAANKIGVGINQFMFVCTIVFLPSLTSLQDRAVLMAGVLGLAFVVNWLHKHYLPNAAIHLGKRSESWLTRALPSAASWLIGIAASVAATLLAAYLKGWFSLPSN